MDEALSVLRRLRRIEALEREGASARSLLAEVHALVDEAEAWVSAEAAAPGGSGTDLAEAALARCRDAFAHGVRRAVPGQGKESAMR